MARIRTSTKEKNHEDFWRPVIREKYSTIRQPPIKANNFELKPGLITMVKKNPFKGHPSKELNEHLANL